MMPVGEHRRAASLQGGRRRERSEVLQKQRMQWGSDSGVGSPAFYFTEAFLSILLLSCVCQAPWPLGFVYVCTCLCLWCLLRPQGVRSLGARVTNVSELPDLGAGIWTLGLLTEQKCSFLLSCLLIPHCTLLCWLWWAFLYVLGTFTPEPSLWP